MSRREYTLIIDIKKFEELTFPGKTAPVFSTFDDDYTISCPAKQKYAFGIFAGKASVSDYVGKTLKATVSVVCYGKGKETKAMPMLAFYAADGRKIRSDYLKCGKGVKYSVTAVVPSGADTVSFELIAYTFGGGVDFFTPTVELTEDIKPRGVTVATAYFKSQGSTVANMSEILSLIDEAASSSDKPDIICFTESAHDIGASEYVFLEDGAEDLERVAQSARKNGIYVIFTYHEQDTDGCRYNTAAVISPKGEVVGKYRKTQLTLGELKAGLTPGASLPVIDLPFGKIGIIICWDQWFYENSRVLTRKGAEIIFWPSRGYHEERIVTRARDNGVYYVSSHTMPEHCCIVHPTSGNILARGSGTRGFVTARIDLSERPMSEYTSFGKMGGNDREIFLTERRGHLYK